MKWLAKRFREWLNDEWSYRAESGVRILVTGRGGRLSVDLDDEQTREVLRRQLEKYARYEVKNGKLVKREGRS